MPTEKQLANLEKGKKTRFKSGEEAAKMGAKGGKASGKTRAAAVTFKQLDLETTTTDELLQMLKTLKKLAMKGNIRAMELYLKIRGELENRVSIEVPSSERTEELKKLIDGYKSDNKTDLL